MHLEALRTYLNTKKGTTEEMPFGPDALVFKVVGKMYALIGHNSTPLRITLKCDPELSFNLRGQYSAIEPGYHMNKKHWITITLDGSVPESELLGLIDHSYTRVVKGLKKAEREQLQR